MTISPYGHYVPDEVPDESELSSAIELNDADILKVESVLQVLNSRGPGQRRNLEDFRKEILERFGGAGFKTDVKVFEALTYGGEQIFVYKIEIIGRYEGAFDPDQMVAEVTADVLDLGTKGVIKSSGLWVPPGNN